MADNGNLPADENPVNVTEHSDEYFMREAMKEAELAADIGEVPVGAVIVAGNSIIAVKCNVRICSNRNISADGVGDT